MQALLLTIELLVSVGLVVVVLLQRSEGGALGIGGGSGGAGGLGGLFSPRGAADTLTRTTTILGILFFVTCIALNLFALRGRDERSFLQTTTPPAATAPVKPATPAPAPSGPSVPVRH